MTGNIPTEAQSELVIVAREWRETLRLLDARGHLKQFPPPDRFSCVIGLEDRDESKLDDNEKALKQHLLTLPYTDQSLKKRLEQILSMVPQIKATCVTPWGLAKALDLLLFDNPEIPRPEPLKSDDDVAAYLTERFFEEPFIRMALVHLYNLKTDQREIILGEMNARILTLTETDLPLITGESTYLSSLHYSHTGNCFFVCENAEIDEPRDWLGDAWGKAWDFITVLKYLKNVVVDIDYAGKFYKPTWSNKVRRYGVDIMGRPRWNEQPAPYHLSDEVLPKLHQWITAKISLDSRPKSSSTLVRSFDLAATRYHYHHTKDSEVEQLLDLTIALEALFSPRNRMELSFRISQNVALMLGNDATERRDIFDFAKKMYGKRSEFVHGGKDPIESGEVTVADIQRLGDLVRQALLRFGTLLARGEESRQKIHDEIGMAAFDSASSNDLRARSDVEILLQESFPLTNPQA